MSADDEITRQERPAEASVGGGLALFTDLYQLTMLQAYFEERMTERAVFSLFVRRLPPRRNFLIACGLDPVLDYLESLRFTQQDLNYLDSLEIFSDRFLAWLTDFRFTGDIHAMREGTPVLANEPILEVEAPLPEAQLIETFVMNQVQLQTMLASKAHRVVTAARGRSVIDFGARRMHGTDAALNSARAFWIAGVNATSNVLAGKQFGIPVAGTLAHSYIQAHGDEAAAFLAFAKLYPDTVLLVDTYDTLTGVDKVVELAKQLGDDFKVRAVRLDSGDLLDLSLRVRDALDQAGLDPCPDHRQRKPRRVRDRKRYCPRVPLSMASVSALPWAFQPTHRTSISSTSSRPMRARDGSSCQPTNPSSPVVSRYSATPTETATQATP